ncbi:MAG: NAD(P)/FAD-dependent oxidoreductase [Actinomycetota bacterium]|nr:NAD(P)/FAD-dependent oxidoreductase [Actinomycetota bacterium]
MVVGGGFGGAFAAREAESRLRERGAHILLVAPENYLLFSPILPEVASGTVEPRHAVVPLRELLKSTDVLIGAVTSIDVAARRACVRTIDGDEGDIVYRSLVLAPGSRPATLPIPGVKENAVGFKSISDAIWLRNRVLHQLEAASAAGSRQRRRELLTFTFVGGGYAGVEALAELESLVREVLPRYPSLRSSDFRWVLVEAQDTLLPGLEPRLAEYTAKVLSARGVEVRVSTRLNSAEDKMVVLSDPQVEPYRSEVIAWTIGQKPSPLTRQPGLPVDDRGRIEVDEYLRVNGLQGVYAVGDSAAVPNPDGGLCPPTAQHAFRQGIVCGRNVAADFGVGSPAPFTYRTRGLAVTLGQGEGTAQVRRFLFRGWPAWSMGRAYHLLMMPAWGRRVRIVSDWTISVLFHRDVTEFTALGEVPPAQLPEY